MRRPGRLMPLLLLLGACAQNAPAGERGFFGGLGAAISGEDERQAQTIESRAQTAETRALEARAAAVQAEQRQAATASAVRDAERRLAALDSQIARMRQELAATRARRPNDPQGAALSGRIEQLDRERAAAARAPDPATAQRLERQGQELGRALEAYGRL